MSGSLARLIQVLRGAGLALDHRQLEEILWLSCRLPLDVRRKSKAESLPSEPYEPLPKSPMASPVSVQKPATLSLSAPSSGIRKPEASVYSNIASAGEGTKATRVRVPGIRSLPKTLEINRALRPLLRRTPSKRTLVLDEEATVQQSAESGILTPVFRPGKERWFDVALVVEDKPSMRIWHETISEFHRLLEHHGAFRDVRRWRLNFKGNSARIISLSDTSQDYRLLKDPTGRRLIILISDGVSQAWRDGAAASVVGAWAEVMPVVVAQVLSERLWHLTPIGKPTAQISALRPGVTNRELHISPAWWDDNPLDGRLALPLITLDPESISQWAKMLTASGSFPAVLLPLTPALKEIVPPDAQAEATAEERLERFRYLCSETAYRLAIYLSAVPLQLPVMRLVQRVMLPFSRLEHLSEVLLGGIIKRRSPDDESRSEDEIDLDFYDGVRERLQTEIRRNELFRVLDETSKFISERLGQPCDFRALVVDAEGVSRIPEAAKPFAHIAEQALARFGILHWEVSDDGPDEKEADAPFAFRTPLDELIERVTADNLSRSQGPREEVDFYISHLAQARQANSLWGEISALDRLGNAFSESGELSTAIEIYEQALDAAQRLGDLAQQIHAFSNLARALADAGFFDRAIARFDEALQAARSIADRAAEGQVWSGKGDVYAKFGDWNNAARSYEEGRRCAQATGDKIAERRFLKQLVSVASRRGDTDSAISLGETALKIQRQAGDRRGELETLIGLGSFFLMREEPTYTIDYYHVALVISSEIGDRPGEALVLVGLGMAYEQSGEIHRAVEFYERALPIYREISDRAGEANVLSRLGLAEVHLDELDRAREHYEQALTIFRELNDRNSEALTLDNLGSSLAALERHQEALSYYEQALAIYRELDDLAAEGQLLERMSLTIAHVGEREQALAWAEAALKIYEEMVLPDAERVRDQIAQWRHISRQPQRRDSRQSPLTELKVIMFTDQIDSTRRMAELTAAEINRLVREQNDLTTDAVRQCRGVIRKDVGNAHLIEFRSCADAVRCGFMIQQRVWDRNQAQPSEALKFALRIGIDFGEAVVLENGDLQGQVVNLAARVSAKCPEGEIYFTKKVMQELDTRSARVEHVGAMPLKGIAGEVNIYRLVQWLGDIEAAPNLSSTEIKVIMFTDQIDSTRHMAGRTPAEMKRITHEQDDLTTDAVRQCRGVILRDFGDGHMIEFRSCTDAVRCGFLLQQRVRERNQAQTSDTLKFALHVGIDFGEVVVLENGDLRANAANLAARVSAKGPEGEVYFTEKVMGELNTREAQVEHVGAMPLKGVAGEVNIYRLARWLGEIEATPNPFIWRTTITRTADLFDRDSEQRALRSFLQNRQSLQIVGPRRIGKTSLLRQIERKAAEWESGAVVAYMDLQDARSYTLPGWLRRVSRLFAWTTIATNLEELVDSIEAMSDAGKRPVLCLDEFEALALWPDEFTSDFFMALRVCTQYGLSIVTASQRSIWERGESTERNERTSPLSNIFWLLRLGPFAEMDAREFVTIYRPGIAPFTDEEKKVILEFAKGHPLALQIACFHVIEERANEGSLTSAMRKAADEMRSHLPAGW